MSPVSDLNTCPHVCTHPHTCIPCTHIQNKWKSMTLEKILVHLVPIALKVLSGQELYSIPLISKAPFNTRPKRQNAGSCSSVAPVVSRLRQDEPGATWRDPDSVRNNIALGSGEMLVSFYGKSSLKLIFTEACSQWDGICCHFVLLFKEGLSLCYVACV